MADAAPPAAKPVKAKAPKAAKKPAAHPPYITMIAEAITALKERDGSSLPAIKKYIESHHGKVRDTLVAVRPCCQTVT